MIVTKYTGDMWKPWLAWDDDATEGDVGRGQTEAEAIADLEAWSKTLEEDDE